MSEEEGDGHQRNARVTDGGIGANMDVVRDAAYPVSPTLGDRHNTLRHKFLPVACWRIDDHRFHFDSSFLLPTGEREFALLAEKRPPGPLGGPSSSPMIHVVQTGEYLDKIARNYGFASWKELYYAPENEGFRSKRPDPNTIYPGDELVIPGQSTEGEPEAQEDPQGLRLTVFGHADPIGKDDYNQVLAGRRARAVYAVLVRDTKIWDELYAKPHGGDDWSLLHMKVMLGALGYDPGPADAQPTQAFANATKAFQQGVGLPPSGSVDNATRRRLFRAYMDFLCVDKSGRPFRYNRKDFLSHGESADGKGDYQSCGEFNPVLVFSKEEEADYQRPENLSERDSENSSNRRVVVYLFPPEPKFPIAKWPCPGPKEGMAACRARFWPDGDTRRTPQDVRREHLKAGRTFACRWYDSIARRSSCEAVRGTLELWPLDIHGQRMPGSRCRVTMGGAVYDDLMTDPQGLLVLSNTYVQGRCELEWSPPDAEARGDGNSSAAKRDGAAPAQPGQAVSAVAPAQPGQAVSAAAPAQPGQAVSAAALVGEPSYDENIPESKPPRAAPDEAGTAAPDEEPQPAGASHLYRRTVWLDTARGDERHVDRQLHNLGHTGPERDENLAEFSAAWTPVEAAGPNEEVDDDVGLVHERGTPKNKTASP